MQFVNQVVVLCVCAFIGVMHAIPNPAAMPEPEPGMAIGERQVPTQGGPVTDYPYCCRGNPGTGGTICWNNTFAQWSANGDDVQDCYKYSTLTQSAYYTACFDSRCANQTNITPKPVTIQPKL
ncbi:hypothetical protein ACMFMG_003555 [Clarireedia jacksonii]